MCSFVAITLIVLASLYYKSVSPRSIRSPSRMPAGVQHCRRLLLCRLAAAAEVVNLLLDLLLLLMLVMQVVVE